MQLPLWRNRLARSAVNRKVGGSSPPRGAGTFVHRTDFVLHILQDWLQVTLPDCCHKFDMQKCSPNVGLEPTTLRLRVSCSTD